MTSAVKERSIWARVSKMSRDELRARFGQEAGKRVDLVRYRLGLRRWTPRPKDSATAPSFFFAQAELPQLVHCIRERLPLDTKAIIEEANEICLHRFRLLGYTALDYGAEIDWHLDAVHRKRAPRKAGYRIDFLDFEKVGDHKVIWELNRHQHLLTLAKAWLLTDDRQYVDELAAQWYAWRRANPYPMGINWASSLEAGFRSLSWLWIRELLAGCDACRPSLARDLVRGLAVHGRYIERNLSIYFSPNTHLIGEAVALFFIGTLCPQIPAAPRWRELGWRLITAEAARQVGPDGLHVEQSLHYHVYALDFFLHARQLAVRNAVEIPDEFEQTILKMLEALQALARAAPPEGFGDDDGGRVFNPRRNRTEQMTDPLAVGAGIFARPEFKAVAGLTEESVWLLGLEGLSLFNALRDCPPLAQPKALEDGGIYLMGSTPSGAPAQQIAIDAGPQGTRRSGHGHADALSVRAGLGGRRWLIDPGTFSYTAGEERDWFRGTAAHNTLCVDGQDQAVPEGPFAWSALPSVQVERWLPGITLALFAGNHTGYARLPDPVLHRRFVVEIRGADAALWLIRDLAEGRETHHLEVFWHFAADTSIEWAGDAFVAAATPAQRARPSDGSGPTNAMRSERVTLFGARDAGWTRELTSAHVSRAYGARQDAPLVKFEARTKLPAECATLILRGQAPPGARFERLGADPRAESRPVSAYRYRDADSRLEFVFAEGDDAWTFASWASDARFVYARWQDEQLAHVVLVDGSFAEFEGKSLASCPRKLQRFEWLKVGGEAHTFSSGDEAELATSRERVRVT